MAQRRIVLRVVCSIFILLIIAFLTSWRSFAAPSPGSPGNIDGNAAQSGGLISLEDPIPGGPGFLMVSALGCRPLSINYLYTYQGVQLYNPGDVEGFYECPLFLPNKVMISRLVVYYYDTAETLDLSAALYRIAFDGLPSKMAEVYSTGSEDAYRFVETTSIDEALIDQQNYSYIIQIRLPVANAKVRLVNLRIDFAYQAVLPLVEK